MPQMSPMYWLLISFFVYLNFMLVVILVNTIGLNFVLMKFKYNMNLWKWMW